MFLIGIEHPDKPGLLFDPVECKDVQAIYEYINRFMDHFELTIPESSHNITYLTSALELYNTVHLGMEEEPIGLLFGPVEFMKEGREFVYSGQG